MLHAMGHEYERVLEILNREVDVARVAFERESAEVRRGLLPETGARVHVEAFRTALDRHSNLTLKGMIPGDIRPVPAEPANNAVQGASKRWSAAGTPSGGRPMFALCPERCRLLIALTDPSASFAKSADALARVAGKSSRSDYEEWRTEVEFNRAVSEAARLALSEHRRVHGC